jgi:signal transduction histidine kinase
MLRTQRLNEAAASQALVVIERNTLVQARLIEDLLDVSRIVAGTLHLESRPTMVEPAVEAVVALMRPGAEAKGIRLESQIDGPAGPVFGDPARLQQVVWNLVANAIKFTPSGGQVEVRLTREAPSGFECETRAAASRPSSSLMYSADSTLRTRRPDRVEDWGSGSPSCAISSSSTAGLSMRPAPGSDRGRRSP